MAAALPEMLALVSDFRKAQFGIGRGKGSQRIECGLLLRKGLKVSS